MTIGGALIALAGLLALLTYLGTGAFQILGPSAAVALGLGSCLLALAPGGIVGASRTGRIALVVFGVGPLVDRLAPPSVLVGMSILVLVTIATVLVAVRVASAAVLRGAARWTPLVLAADALLTATLSSVPLGALPLRYLGWHLELIRPLALLIWGLAIVLHARGATIRRRLAAIDTEWKRSTDVSGSASVDDAAHG